MQGTLLTGGAGPDWLGTATACLLRQAQPPAVAQMSVWSYLMEGRVLLGHRIRSGCRTALQRRCGHDSDSSSSLRTNH